MYNNVLLEIQISVLYYQLMSVTLIILIFHVIGACVLLGSSITALFLAFSKKFTKETGNIINHVRSLVPIAAIAQLFTGMYLFMQDRKEFESQSIFTIKLVLYVVSGILGSAILGKKAKAFANGKDEHGPALKFLMVVDFLILLVIVGIGVWLVEKPE